LRWCIPCKKKEANSALQPDPASFFFRPWHIIREIHIIFAIPERIPVWVLFQFVDEGVELQNRHQGNSFITLYLLFNKSDEEGNRILTGDGGIKCGSFSMLFNSLF
jgi:hypothetical protein